MLYTIILMASFHLCISSSPPLLMDIRLQSFNHISVLSFVFYAFLLFTFFLAMFSSVPQWADFEFNFFYLFALLSSLSSSSALPSVTSQYPSLRLREYFPRNLSQSYFCLLLLHRKRKFVWLCYPKSTMISKLFNYQPSWSQWPAYFCTI